MDNYPEHLNPFAEKKNKLGIKSSFRKFKRNLQMSFRRKAKEEVELRPKLKPPPPSTSSRSYTPSLPRSRFSERVRQSDSSNIPQRPARKCDSLNPFEIDEEDKPFRKRKKKAAPLPPKSSSELELSEGRSRSNWSLTSNETEASYGEGSQNSLNIQHSENVTAYMQEVTSYMEKLTCDTESDVAEKKTVPDLVIDCDGTNTTEVKGENEGIDEEASSNLSQENIKAEADEKNSIIGSDKDECVAGESNATIPERSDEENSCNSFEKNNDFDNEEDYIQRKNGVTSNGLHIDANSNISHIDSDENDNITNQDHIGTEDVNKNIIHVQEELKIRQIKLSKENLLGIK